MTRSRPHRYASGSAVARLIESIPSIALACRTAIHHGQVGVALTELVAAAQAEAEARVLLDALGDHGCHEQWADLEAHEEIVRELKGEIRAMELPR